MFTRRSLVAIVAGGLGFALALVAIVLDAPVLVAAAAVLAFAALFVVLRTRPVEAAGSPADEVLAAHAAELTRQQELVAERAARFEAEAIAARAQLAQAMRAEMARQEAATDRAAGIEPMAAPDPAPAPAPSRPAPAPSTGDVITDAETGLFTELFFQASLVKRISASRRGLRPLTVAVAEVVTGIGTPELAPAPVAVVAHTMLNVFREADTLARGPESLFLILLEDTPENGAIWTLERLRRRIAEDHPGFTLRVGLSCYPAYGFDADQLMRQALGALEAAREWQQDRIEVTTSSPDD